MRPTGKSIAAKLFEEKALDEGLTVAVYDMYGETIKKRKKHLTVMKFKEWRRNETTNQEI